VLGMVEVVNALPLAFQLKKEGELEKVYMDVS
jgi:hypothetical protein